MISVDSSLVASYYTGAEFKSSSALNAGVSIEDLNEKMVRPAKRGCVHRKKSQSRARKSMRF